MITDGKFIEENSIPLDRLMSTVVTASDYNSDAEALNTRISKIENLEMDSGTALQDFNTVTNAHFATLINDESTESAPTHSIKLDTVTDAMLNSNLKDKIVYTDQVRTITANDTFSGAVSFTGSATYTGAANNTEVLKVTKGVTSLKNTNVGGDLSVTGSSTLAGLTVNGAVSVTGNLTVAGTTTTVNSTNLQVQDRIISVGQGGSVPGSGTEAGIEVGINGYNDIKKPRLVYKGDGWYIRNHSTTNAAQTESKIVTEAYLASQGYAASSNMEATIKTTLKKYIAMGTCNVNTEVNLASVASTFAANIGTSANGSDYQVFVNPIVASGSPTAIDANCLKVGEIQVQKLASKKFKILTSGITSPGITFSWVAINKAICS